MVTKKDKAQQEELTKIQSLLETENESLDLHVLDYFTPASDKMVSHIEEKTKYLTRYAKLLEDLCNDDVGIGLLNGLIDEIRDIKLELRRCLQSSLSDHDPTIDTRGHLNHFTKVSNVILVDLINRLQRIQRVLNTAYMMMTEDNN